MSIFQFILSFLHVLQSNTSANVNKALLQIDMDTRNDPPELENIVHAIGCQKSSFIGFTRLF